MLKFTRLIYFSLAIVLASIICLPIACLRPFNYKNSGLFLKIFYYLALPIGLKGEVINAEKRDQSHPSIFVGNHQDNLDIWVASFAFQNRIVALGKKEILLIPFFGLFFGLSGNIFINRKNKEKAKQSLEKVKSTLNKNKISVVIFPEGHRNPSKALLPFKKGAFITAIQAQLPITIFAISRYTQNIDLNKKIKSKIKISFLDPIPTVGLTIEDVPELLEKCSSLLESEIQRISS